MQSKTTSKAIILIPSYIFIQPFFHVSCFSLQKLTLQASVLKVKVPCSRAIFGKQQRKNICELLLLLFTSMHFNCWAKKKPQKRIEQCSRKKIYIYIKKSINRAEYTHHICVCMLCRQWLYSFIYPSLWLKASPPTSCHCLLDEIIPCMSEVISD